jgi:hypothetical protein
VGPDAFPTSSSCSRVAGVMRGSQVLLADVGIDGGGRDRLVAGKLLSDAQIGAALQTWRWVAVVWRNCEAPLLQRPIRGLRTLRSGKYDIDTSAYVVGAGGVEPTALLAKDGLDCEPEGAPTDSSGRPRGAHRRGVRCSGQAWTTSSSRTSSRTYVPGYLAVTTNPTSPDAANYRLYNTGANSAVTAGSSRRTRIKRF